MVPSHELGMAKEFPVRLISNQISVAKVKVESHKSPARIRRIQGTETIDTAVAVGDPNERWLGHKLKTIKT